MYGDSRGSSQYGWSNANWYSAATPSVGSSTGGTSWPQLWTHSSTKLLVATRARSRLRDAVWKLIAQVSVGPPQRTSVGTARSGEVGRQPCTSRRVVPEAGPTPPERTSALARRSERASRSCEVQSAPALTPTLEMQSSSTLYCAATQASMSSKKATPSGRGDPQRTLRLIGGGASARRRPALRPRPPRRPAAPGSRRRP